MYNSGFFSTTATYEYDTVFEYEPFLQAGPQSAHDQTTDPRLKNIQTQATSWDRLEPAACINAYATEFLTTRRNLVAVISANEQSPTNTSVQEVVSNAFEFSIKSPGAVDPYAWICDTPDGDSRYEFDQAEMEPSFHCSSKVSKVRTHSDSWQWKMWDIKYCLSEPVEGKSSLNFNLPIIVVVILCNMGKSLLMFFVAFGIKDDPLVTIGDAVGSFLKCNDPTAEGMCLVSKEDIEADECVHFHRGLIDFNDDAPDGSTGFSWLSNEKPEPIRYQPSVKRWLKAASGPRWWACALLPVPRYPP
jgi:hypothetical protein